MVQQELVLRHLGVLHVERIVMMMTATIADLISLRVLEEEQATQAVVDTEEAEEPTKKAGSILTVVEVEDKLFRY